jgi:type IV fimbrial biogenesis protein FimT
MRKNSGFTLIEMMVVIGVIGILSMIAIPNIISWLPKHRLGSATRSLLSAMQYARLVAVKENVDIFVKFDPPNDIYILYYDSDEIQAGDETTLRKGNMPGGVSIIETNFTGDRFKFNSRGLASGSGGTISISNNLNDLKKIRINRTGNSRILAIGED